MPVAIIAAAQIRRATIEPKKVLVKPVVDATVAAPKAAFAAYASYWAFNKPCNTNRQWLITAENILKKEGLQIFDLAKDNNISVGGYHAEKRVLVTVICVAAPNNRTSVVLNVFTDDGNINKTMGELFRKKFEGVTMIDCG